MSKVVDIDQRSEEWYKLRMGRFTCSEVHKLMTEPRAKAAKKAGELSETAKTYIMDKVAEAITGQRHEISGPSLEWGQEWEPYAKSMYEQVFNTVHEVGFLHDDYLGGSPDGLVGDKGGIEIKCPFNQGVHLSNLLLTPETFKSERKEYYWQIQGYLKLTGRDWFDFVSFDHRFPEEHCMQVIRIERNEDDILLMMDKVEKACKLRDEILARI